MANVDTVDLPRLQELFTLLFTLLPWPFRTRQGSDPGQVRNGHVYVVRRD
jgi:hypothetical protein